MFTPKFFQGEPATTLITSCFNFNSGFGLWKKILMV